MIRKFFKAIFAPFSSPVNSFDASLTVTNKVMRKRVPTGPRSELMIALTSLEVGDVAAVPSTTKSTATQLIKRAQHHRPTWRYSPFINQYDQLSIERTA